MWFKLVVTHKLVPNHEAEFIAKLQSCHDSSYADPLCGIEFVDRWKEKMRILADQFDLSTDVLKDEPCPVIASS